MFACLLYLQRTHNRDVIQFALDLIYFPFPRKKDASAHRTLHTEHIILVLSILPFKCGHFTWAMGRENVIASHCIQMASNMTRVFVVWVCCALVYLLSVLCIRILDSNCKQTSTTSSWDENWLTDSDNRLHTTKSAWADFVWLDAKKTIRFAQSHTIICELHYILCAPVTRTWIVCR